ncbi:hypothetical protein MMC07_002624 [Pseudocyphellaria aurata]|nr:hypothetical protein [Pseudocyphellaria aurata]
MPGWFSLSFAYNEGLKDAIKSLPSSQRRYNPDNRSWDVHADSYDVIIAQLQVPPHNVVIQAHVEDTSQRQHGSQGGQSSQGAGPSTPPQAGLKIAIQYPTPSIFTVQFGQAAHGTGEAFQAALDIVRGLPASQRSYDKDARCWSVDRAVLQEVLEAFRQPPVDAQLEMPPQPRYVYDLDANNAQE